MPIPRNGPRTPFSRTPTATRGFRARGPTPHCPTCFRRARTTSCRSGGRTPITPRLIALPTPAHIHWVFGHKVSFTLTDLPFHFDPSIKIQRLAHLRLSSQPSPNYPVSEFPHLPHSYLRHRQPNLLPHPVHDHQRPAAAACGRKLHLG